MVDPLGEDGWHIWDMTAAATWPSMWPPVRYRRESDTRIAVCAALPPRAANVHGHVHGAFLAGLGEHVAGVHLRVSSTSCSTVSIAFDYPAPAGIDAPILGWVDLVRETGRMQFLRVELSSGDEVVLHGIATLRKFRP